MLVSGCFFLTMYNTLVVVRMFKEFMSTAGTETLEPLMNSGRAIEEAMLTKWYAAFYSYHTGNRLQ